MGHVQGQKNMSEIQKYMINYFNWTNLKSVEIRYTTAATNNNNNNTVVVYN